MTASIKNFYPKLLRVQEIVELVEHYFGENAHHVLEAMKAGEGFGTAEADDLEELLQDFVTDHATEVASFQGLGQGGENSSQEAMDYFEKYHPEAHDMMVARTQELQKLLGKDGAAAALGQSREPFAIRVFQYAFLYVVTAEEFENEFFDDENEAIEFAQSNYKPWIERYEKNLQQKPIGK